ncbi:MAG: AraC family transcriptional regulator, partial [Bacteroidetes bacterium]
MFEKLQQPRDRKTRLLLGFFELLDAHFPQPLSIAQLARRLHCSPRHLRRTCRQILGCTPKECLLARRLAEAQALLANPDLDITAIAYRCGFSSPAHFSARFKA